MFWLLLLLVFTPGQTVDFTDEPRLETVDGNLWIYAAKDRNITLATSSRGAINVNGQDLQGIVETARAAIRSAASHQEAVSTVQTIVRAMQEEIINVNQRLAAYEAQNGSNIGISRPGDISFILQPIHDRLSLLETNLRKNECARNPCRHGGRCLDLYLKFGCICPDGWEGRRCQKDTNECAVLYGTDLGCQNGATCVNKPGTYECICRPGFFGRHCTKRTNDCSSGSAEMCDHGICVTVDGDKTGYKCICDQGWMKAPGQESCSVDVDECTTAPCSKTPKVNCINIPGSFRCESCPPGYTGNGHSCDDVNECLTNNGDCSISPRIDCINTIGSSRCGPCPPGYMPDGKSCHFVGRCRANNGGCHIQATCQEIGLSVVCTCVPGFTGSGIGVYGCLPASVIAPNNGNPCASNPCVNGRCLSISAFNYSCDCYVGYTGLRCEKPRNPCQSAPCQNGGKCIPRGTSFRCNCTNNYIGRTCASERYECGGFLGADEGVLTFPTNGAKYKPNLSCAWQIRVNATKVVKLTFDRFSLQPRTNIFSCTADWLQIYDGKEFGDNNRIGKYCGNELQSNQSITSTGNSIFLWFKSDRISNFEGFKLRWNVTEPTCGGILNATVHGSFSSPGSPGNYPPNRDCYWTITTDLTQRITFTFFQQNIEKHDNCTADYIAFFDGTTTNDPMITRFCTSGTPAPLVSPGNTVLVHFHSDGVSSDRGFQIAYHPTPGIPGCGGIFTQRQGDISSLNSGGRYQDNLDCVWLIRVNPEQRIKVTFQSMGLEGSRSCRNDFLEIRYGSNNNAPLAGRFCGNTIPLPISSIDNELFIRFRTDGSVSHKGFSLSYEELCSKTFVDPTGIIKSTNYPNEYPGKLDCTYLISQPPGKAIILNFLDFELESSAGTCYHDYLQIYDGLDTRSPSKGRFCGKKRPDQIISSNNKLFIYFRTDLSINFRGWAANYSTIDTVCGGVLDGISGTISSPTIGSEYLHDITCQWVIHVPQGKVIQINFITFVLEGPDYANECRFDYLEVYNNASPNDEKNKIGRFCGSKIPPPLISSGNVILLKFVTDSSRALDGFQLTYNAVNSSSLCGGNFFFQSGVIKSPNYPGLYPNNKLCSWVIQVPMGRQVKLVTRSFRLEDSSDCSFDWVEIRNGGNENSPLIGKYCGAKKPPTITSFSNQLFIRFSSDVLRSASGFEMTWDGKVSGCGGLLTAATGSITSPNYPQAYGRNALCYYKIRISSGSRISLIFVDIELEEAEDCIHDYLQVFDGSNDKAQSLIKLCSNSRTIDPILSTSNQLFVKFESDTAVAGKGFMINYKTQCNVTITGQRGVIESPNYPVGYPPGSVCVWTIVPELGHTVNISFTEFNMPSTACNETYLEIKEGERDRPPTNSLGKYCNGKEAKYGSIISSSLESVTISLVSNREARGIFRFEWVSVGCGGSFDRAQGVFTSPNYPNFYPKLTECVWKISVDPESSVKLIVSDINIEPAKDCLADVLEVYGGPDKSSPLLTKICQYQQSQITVESSSNFMTVVFRTDFFTSGKGFSAAYSTIPSKCGGLQKSIAGQIHSRNYPNNYDIHDDCMWTIRVDPQHRVNFTFDDFDMPADLNCTKSYIEVFDGDYITSTSLLKVCGNRMPDVKSVISSSNVLLVRLKSGLPYSTKGFKASYFMTCGAVIQVDSPGMIVLNEAVTTSKDVTNCTWTLTSSEPDGHITAAVTVLDFDLIDINDPCQFTFLEVFDGDNKNASSIGRACGTTIPLPFVSTGNALFLQYTSAWNHRNTLQVAYSPVTSACGGEFYGISGSFASPGYPGGYPANVECLWILKSAAGNFLQVALDLKIAPNEKCNTEYMEIRRGSGTGQLLGVFCDTFKQTFTSSTGFWIKFVSGPKPIQTETELNFKAEYSLLALHELNGTSGQIASPLYPRPYLQKVEEMAWRVTVGYAKRIKFTFDDLLMNPNCRSRVSIYDGFDDTAVETKFCDTSNPTPYISSSNVAFLKLFSLNFINGVKFLVNWQEIATLDPLEAKNMTSTPSCGGDYYLDVMQQSMKISFPSNYSASLFSVQCEWVIRAPQGYHLGYRLLKIHIQPSRLCQFEYLATFDGDSPLPIQKYCLQNQTHDSSTAVEVGSTLRVVFSSNYLSEKRDFELQVDLDHGGTIEASNGIIDFNWNVSVTGNMYYRYGLPYYFYHVVWPWWIQRKLVHEWTIKVNRGRRIRVTFEDFDVAAALDNTCKEKYVMLRNGHHSDSPFLGIGKYCGKKPINIPLTSSEFLYVKIYTPWRTSTFKLKFEEVGHSCGGNFMLPPNLYQLSVQTPNYPNSPHPKIQCTWMIRGPVGRTLHVNFVDRFDLKVTDESCSGEYVEVFDGSSILSESLGRFCQNPPSTIKTSDNVVLIKYFTNVTDPNNGFQAQITFDSCDLVIRSATGVLTTPGYPELKPGIECTWKIQTYPYQQLRINFVDVDLPPPAPIEDKVISKISDVRLMLLLGRRNCTYYNTLILSDSDFQGLTSIRRFADSFDQLKIFCANKTPESVTSASNTFYIKFRISNFESYHNYRGLKLKFSSIDTECGGNLATPDGVISSPYYPQEVPRPYYCIWNVRVPPGRRITVRFIDFDLAGNHMEQRLYLYEASFRSEIAVLHRLTIPQEEYKTTGNTLKVSYQAVAFSGTAHRGFRISYSSNEAAECGGYINSTNGIIEPPQNKTQFYCEWVFPQRNQQNFSLVFNLENARLGNISHIACNYYNAIGLMIYVDDDPSKFKKQLCGNISDQVIVSPFGNIKVKSSQSKPFSAVTFRLKYAISNCGGVITSSMLPYTLTTPGYNDDEPKYPSNAHCAWRIDTEPGQTLKVTINDFQLEKTCRDYLAIYNGGDSESPLIDKYCGISLPTTTIISQDESLFIHFHSDESTEGKGLKLAIENNHTDCGGILYNPGVDLRTPGFPNAKYEANVECEWEIHSLSGSHVGLVFVDRFQLESSDGCVNDFVKIYDMKNNNWELIKTFCGRDTPSPVNSTSSRMRILFRSNSEINGDGFRAIWNRNCGATLNNTRGRILSPGFPVVYPANQNCEYTIIGNGQLITLNFTFFKLENSGSGCKFDYVEISEIGTHSVFHGRYCGTNSPKLITSNKDIKIVFRTDALSHYPGFAFEYNVDKCGGNVTENAVIQYTLPRNTKHNSCKWHIYDPVKNMVAAIQFTNVSLLSHDQCAWSSLKVMTRITPSNDSYKTLTRFCGEPNAILPFTGKELIIELNQALRSYGSSYFTAYVSFGYGEEQGCGGKLVIGSNPETLVSPDVNRDGLYEEFLECHWLIEAQEDYYLTAKILTLDLQYCHEEGHTNECCDFIEIRDGVGQFSDLILKTCGNSTPEAVSSSSNQMWLRLTTDDLYSGRGFVIQFSSQLSQCGKKIHEVGNKTDILTSPGYPNGYPAGIRCSWTLTIPDKEGSENEHVPVPIHVHITNWDFEDSDDCTNDYLSIEDYGSRSFRGNPDKNANVGDGGMVYHGGRPSVQMLYTSLKRAVGKTKYCGKGEGLDFYASSKTVVVEMVTNGEKSGKGFSLEYGPSACSRNYTKNQGRIRRSSYKAVEKCIIRITAPSINDTIALYFSTFALAQQCDSAYLEVRDGPDVSANSLFKTCGYNRPAPVYSSGPNLYIEIYSSISRYSDIDITYTTTDQGQGCGGTIFNYGGTFTSPKYPQYIRENGVCRWDVSVPDGLIIVFKFRGFDMGPSSTCNTDFIEFLKPDAVTGDLTLQSRFCGGDEPGTIIGTTTDMVVRYTRSVHNGGFGWSVEFSGVLPGLPIQNW